MSVLSDKDQALETDIHIVATSDLGIQKLFEGNEYQLAHIHEVESLRQITPELIAGFGTTANRVVVIHGESPRRYDQIVVTKGLLNVHVSALGRTSSVLKMSYFFGRSFVSLTPDSRAAFINKLGEAWNKDTQTVILSRRTIELLFEVIKEVYRTKRAVAVAA